MNTTQGITTTEFIISEEDLDELYSYYCINLTASYECLPVANKTWNFVMEIVIHSIISIFGIIGMYICGSSYNG